MEKYLKFILGSLAIFIAMTCIISCDRASYKKMKEAQNQSLEIDTIEPIIVPTVKEVLEYRENMRLSEYEDSVFLCMPEQVLTNILVTKGTDLTVHEIVSLYISNKDVYDKIIKKSMDIQKIYIPDSMPRSSLPERNADSTHSAFLP